MPAGPVTVRQVGALYPISNNIAVVEMTGTALKDTLEHSASFFGQWPPQPGQAFQLPSSNPDYASGVSYTIDLTQPVGSRIRDLQFHGKPLDPAQKLRVAVTPGRRMGEDGYSMYKGAPVVGRTGDMRDVLIEYVTRTKKIAGEADKNWKIVPPEAVAALEKLGGASAALPKK
jgi:2',3'-cyclic-nucleotide 2'-phosphodiesterase/3'-nucleotidase